MGDALEGVKFGLDGEQEVVRGNHAIDGEEGKGGGRVDDDVVVIVGDARKGVFEDCEFAGLRDKLNFGVGELGSGGDEVEVFVAGRDDGALESDGALHDFNHAGFKFRFVETETGSGVALRVEVNNQGAVFVLGEVVAKVDGSGSFADTSFLIRDTNHNSHIQYYITKNKPKQLSRHGSSQPVVTGVSPYRSVVTCAMSRKFLSLFFWEHLAEFLAGVGGEDFFEPRFAGDLVFGG